MADNMPLTFPAGQVLEYLQYFPQAWLQWSNMST